MASSDVLKLIASLSPKSSHADLLAARNKIDRNNKDAHNKLAPLEHRAFAREFATESPVKASVSLPFAIPLYTASKVLGLQPKARSDASIEEMMQGYKGLVEGVLAAINTMNSDEEDTIKKDKPATTKVVSM